MRDTDSNIKLKDESKEKFKKSSDSGDNLGSTDFDRTFNSLNSYDFNSAIKSILNPKFLGSIHLKKGAMKPNTQLVENLMDGDVNLKMNKSLKSTIFNPITIILILIAIAFNLIWILFSYL